MKILFTGLPYFGKQLVAELNAFDAKNTYVFCDTYYSRKDRFLFLWHLLSAKKVVSFNGATSESGSLNWVLRLNKKLIMQWHGSDVLTAQENVKKGIFTRKYVDRAKSFTDASWLKAELERLDIHATELAFKHVAVSGIKKPFQDAAVLTYLAQGSESFYGAEHFLKLADAFPQVQFHVAGTDGKSLAPKKNVQYYGWISEDAFKEKLDTHAIFIRLTEHDGYSLSVMRAVANGNYVLWNNPHAAVTYVADVNKLQEQLHQLQTLINTVNFRRNEAGILWAQKHLDKNTILQKYVTTLLES